MCIMCHGVNEDAIGFGSQKSSGCFFLAEFDFLGTMVSHTYPGQSWLENHHVWIGDTSTQMVGICEPVMLVNSGGVENRRCVAGKKRSGCRAACPILTGKSWVNTHEIQKYGGKTYMSFTGWWLNQPIWKILVKLGIFPKIGVKIKNVWNHHLVYMLHHRFGYHPMIPVVLMLSSGPSPIKSSHGGHRCHFSIQVQSSHPHGTMNEKTMEWDSHDGLRSMYTYICIYIYIHRYIPMKYMYVMYVCSRLRVRDKKNSYILLIPFNQGVLKGIAKQ